MSDQDREVLAGGGVNEVVRFGGKVIRPTGPWSARVHDLLIRLREVGFYKAPAFHEVTADGYEVVDYIPGEVCNYPVSPEAATEDALRSAAVLLRDYHDATSKFVREIGTDGWMHPSLSPIEVICHDDYAPHNVVLHGTDAVGIIDFDTARPGPRIRDLAHAVYRWAPTTAPTNADGFGTIEEQARRATTFCEVYGATQAERRALPDAIVERLNSLVHVMREQAAAGNEAFASHLADGHHLQYLKDAEYIELHSDEFLAHLTDGSGA